MHSCLAPLGFKQVLSRYPDVIFFTAYIGQSWNILGGYAGQFSFGGVMFFGTGAYVIDPREPFGVPAIIGVVAILAGAVLACVSAISVSFWPSRVLFRADHTGFCRIAGWSPLARDHRRRCGLFLTYAPGCRTPVQDACRFLLFRAVLMAISIAIAIWLENSRLAALVAIRENEMRQKHLA